MKYMHISTLEIAISDIDEYVLTYGQLDSVLMGLVRQAAGDCPGARSKLQAEWVPLIGDIKKLCMQKPKRGGVGKTVNKTTCQW